MDSILRFRRVAGGVVAMVIVLSLVLTATPARAMSLYPFYDGYQRMARADAWIDYLDVDMMGSGTAGGRIALVADGPGSYYVKYRAAQRGPLPWHRGTNNVTKSQGIRTFNWSDSFVLRTWAYEFKICKARKLRKDPCGDPMPVMGPLN